MENNEVKQSGLRCLDCGGQKSTELSIRCWDCALKNKKSNWRSAALIRASDIMSKRDAGMTMVEIAATLGVSRQRVYQVVEAAGLKARRDARGGWRGGKKNDNG